MQIGDLVKRNEHLWEYLTDKEMQEVGMIIAFDRHYNSEYLDTFAQEPQYPYAIVLWSRTGIGYEDIDDLEVVTCKEELRAV